LLSLILPVLMIVFGQQLQLVVTVIRLHVCQEALQRLFTAMYLQTGNIKQGECLQRVIVKQRIWKWL